MKRLPLAKGDYRRASQELEPLPLVNRYVEMNPLLPAEEVSFVSRPSLRRWLEVGPGPIRKIYSQPGAFSDDLFVVSGLELWRVSKKGVTTLIIDNIDGASDTSTIDMVATQSIGTVPEYLFFCAGRVLWCYDGTTCTPVDLPDDLGAKSLGLIASFVIVIPAQGGGDNGKFFWIEPGETFIDPLNFATAEQSPDPIYHVVTVGDQFWLLGQSTTEAWYPTGDPDAPFAPFKGRAFERGVVEGTARMVKDAVILVDNDGSVYSLAGGVNRISDSSVEERIRRALNINKKKPLSE